MKKKTFAILSIMVLFLTSSPFNIQKASATGNTWSRTWHNDGNWTNNPLNFSVTKSVSSPNGNYWIDSALVVSVYEYTTFLGFNTVNFRATLYFDSFTNEIYPVTADFVTLFIDKDPMGSNLGNQYINIVNEASPPGFSQGYGLRQSLPTGSEELDRRTWALNVLGFAVGLIFEPVDIALDLISLAGATLPQGGADYDNAEDYEMQARSYWYNPGYDFGTENPVRQYAFNSWQWLQDYDVNPSSYYGIKVWARVGLTEPNQIGSYFDTPPVYLRINHYSPNGNGGGGCPFVSTWNGTHYMLDNNLLSASEASNGSDVIDYYMLQQSLVQDGNQTYSLMVSEFENEHDFFDQVQLAAVDHSSDVNVAVSPYGEILTYTEPSPPVSAIDDNHRNVKHLLAEIDGDYYEGPNGSYVTLNFGDELDVSEGAKLVMRADFPEKEAWSIHVQVQDEDDNWNTVATVIPRVYWATEIVDLSEYLPDPKGNLKVRLYFTDNHKIDFVGLDTSPQAALDIYEGQLFSAIHSTNGDVTASLLYSDDEYAELVPEQEMTLRFTLPPLTMEERSYLLTTEGHYYTITA